MKKKPGIIFTGKYWFLFPVHWEIGDFEHYLRILEEFLSEYKQNFETNVSSTAATLGKEEKEQYLEHSAELYSTFGKDFPRILRYSSFTFLYSLVEANLENICNYLEPSCGPALKESSDRGIERSKKYLKNVIKIKFPDTTSEWNEIKNYKYIRNCIVHNQGVLTNWSKSVTIKAYINCTQNVEVYNDNDLEKIELKQGFCEKAAKVISAFFKDLYDKLTA